MRHVLTLCAVLCPILCAVECAAAGPNIVLIFTDDQGIHDVGCYGSEIPTPRIDSLANDGLKFNCWYSASSICTPSRYGLLTGKNPIRSHDQLLGALMFLAEEDRVRGLQESETIFPAVLRKAGYRTALIGKWHLGHGGKQFLPMQHGFDSFFGHTGGCVDFYTLCYGVTPDWYRDNELTDVNGYATDIITNEAITFLSRHSDSQPFFLFLSYNAPHFGKGWDDGEGRTVNQLQPPPEDLQRVSGIDDLKRRKYAAKVVNLDDNIGRVLDALDQQGLTDDTLVIFLTDHGGDPVYGGANQPYRGTKATLFEGGIRVPCLMRFPGVIAPGTQTEAVCSSLDVATTLCNLALANCGPTDGIDIVSVLRDPSAVRPNRELYWETGSHSELGRGRWTALRSGDFKYLHDDRENEFLFQIATDPGETTDIREDSPEIFTLLKSRSGRFMNREWETFHERSSND